MSTLADLFAKDPLRLTKEDRAQMIEHFRANRAQFMAGQRTTSVAKASKEPKPKATGKKVTGLSLDDLLGGE